MTAEEMRRGGFHPEDPVLNSPLGYSDDAETTQSRTRTLESSTSKVSRRRPDMPCTNECTRAQTATN